VSSTPGRILLVFLDGVGIGDADARTNPLVRARLPVLTSLLGEIPVRRETPHPPPPNAPGRWTSADATLGVVGRPQSGTGQTALLTGENAAVRFGRHFGPWVPTGLRDLLAQRNLLTRAGVGGRRVAFANAYPSGYLRGPHAARRPGAVPLAAASAGVLKRHEQALRDGRGVASSITNDVWQRHLPDLPSVSAHCAGENLASICREAELTLFAHYDTDLAGHRRDLQAAVTVLERVDEFLGGLLQALPPDALLVIASDHGNIEDARTGHTTNPVPFIAAGPGSEALVTAVRAITDVTPLLMELLNVD
jgi:hypothetical protein